MQVLGTPRHSGPLGCLKYSITVAMSTAWGVCVCVSTGVCAQLQEFRLCQPVPLIFLGQQNWCWKPDPTLSAFFTAVPGKQSSHRNGPSSLLPARADHGVRGHTHSGSLTI